MDELNRESLQVLRGVTTVGVVEKRSSELKLILDDPSLGDIVEQAETEYLGDGEREAMGAPEWFPPVPRVGKPL